MNESGQPVREVEVGCVPLIAIRLQSDESQCVCAEGKRSGGGLHGSFSFFVCVCPYMHVCMCADCTFSAVKLKTAQCSVSRVTALQH